MKTRYFLDLNDILCFEFECNNCHRRLTYEHEDVETRFPHQCPGCNAPWIGADRVNPHPVSLLIGYLTDAKKKQASDSFKLKVEIAPPEKK